MKYKKVHIELDGNSKRVQKVIFPGAVYRKKTQLIERFIGTDTGNAELFFDSSVGRGR